MLNARRQSVDNYNKHSAIFFTITYATMMHNNFMILPFGVLAQMSLSLAVRSPSVRSLSVR